MLWVLIAIFACSWLVIFTPLVHLPAGAKDLGLPSHVGATLLSLIGAGGLVGRLLTGSLSDRIGRVPALAGALILQAAGFTLLAFAREVPWLYTGCLLFGLSYGGSTVLFPAIVGDIFGRVSAGAIVGFIFAVAGSTAAFGPVFAGFLYESTGSYAVAYSVCAGLNVLALTLMLLLPRQPGEIPAAA